MPWGTRTARSIDPASVIGLGFAVEAVVNLVPEDAAPAVLSRLASLTTKQFVRPTVADEEYYRFGHAVIKDAAYRSLLKRTRAELHEHFVDWAEPINRERGREIEFEEILGYHLEQAYRYRTELGAIDGRAMEVGRRGAAKLSSAGRRALTRGDMPTAASLLQRSVELLPPEDPHRIEVLPDLAESLFFGLGQAELAKATAKEAMDAAAGIGDARLVARAEIALILIEQFSGGTSEPPLERANRAMAVLEAHGDEGGIAHAWRLIISIRDKAGQYEEAALAAEQAMVHAEKAGDERLVLRGIALFASMLALGPTPAGRGDRTFRTRRRPRRRRSAHGGDRRREPGADVCDAGLVRSCPRALSARARPPDRARSRASWRRPPPSKAPGSSCSRGTSSWPRSSSDGTTPSSCPSMRPTTERPSPAGWPGSSSSGATSRARAEYSQIALDLAEDDDVDAHVRVQLVQARLLAADNDDRAVAMAEQAVEQSAGMADLILRGDALVDLAQVLTTLRGPEMAEPPLREALALFEQKGDAVSVERVRGLLDRVLA